jgi:hypothetical protein
MPSTRSQFLRRSENKMNVAEQSAIPNLSNLLSKLHWITLSGVMGILIALAVFNPARITDLRTGLDITLSTVVMLVLVHRLQPVHSSVFPSLLLFASFQCLAWTPVILFQWATSEGEAENAVRVLGQIAAGDRFFLSTTIFLAFIVIHGQDINHDSLRFPDRLQGSTRKPLPICLYPSNGWGFTDTFVERQERLRKTLCAVNKRFGFKDRP